MRITVNPHKCEIDRTLVNEKEINVSKCEFVFSEEIPNDYVKEAYFTLNGITYKQLLFNNECDIPPEVLETKGTIEIGVVAYEIQNEQYVKRFNPSPCYQNTLVGSLKDEFENSEEITPSDKEQIISALNDGLNQIDNLDINAEKVDTTTTITITKKDGTTETTQVLDGNGIASITTQESQVDEGNNVITITDTNGQVTTFNVKNGSKGNTGAPGQIKMLIVNELPLTGDGDTIYLLPIQGEQGNNYEEYIYVNGSWEKLGGIQVEVDLSDYYTKEETYSQSEINTLLGGKQNIIDSTHKLDSDLIDDTNSINKFVSSTDITNWNGKLDSSKVKNTNSTTAGDVYDVRYINSLIGDIDTALDLINGEVIS